MLVKSERPLWSMYDSNCLREYVYSGCVFIIHSWCYLCAGRGGGTDKGVTNPLLHVDSQMTLFTNRPTILHHGVTDVYTLHTCKTSSFMLNITDFCATDTGIVPHPIDLLWPGTDAVYPISTQHLRVDGAFSKSRYRVPYIVLWSSWYLSIPP